MNKEADLKDQAKNFRLFEESLTIMKKAWTEDFFSQICFAVSGPPVKAILSTRL